MISSTSNAKVKNILNLKKSAKSRKEKQCFLVEGPRMVFEVPPHLLAELYMTEEFYGKYEEQVLSMESQGIHYELISENVCKHISDTKTPQGIVAIVRYHTISLEHVLSLEENPLFIILENLQDPGNLGTIIRTGEGAGVTAVIMNQGCVDPYNPKVIRSTMGAIFRMPLLIVPDLFEVMDQLHQKGVRTYAAHLSGKRFYDYDYRNGSAFLIGNEGNGLSDELSSMATDRIRIPMKGEVESLNAAIAATVLMYETQRQRDWL